MHKYFTNCAFILLLCLSKSAFAHHSALLIRDAWIAEAPPTSKVMVAYLTLENTGNTHIIIRSATSNSYSSVEFHETKHKDGLARMVRHPSLMIPAKSTVELKRGGKHFMLFNPKERLQQGDEVTMKLIFADGSTKTINIPVKKAQY